MNVTIKSICVSGVLCAFFTAQASEEPSNPFFARLIAADQRVTPEKTEHLKDLHGYWLHIKDDQPAAPRDNTTDPVLEKLAHRLVRIEKTIRGTEKLGGELAYQIAEREKQPQSEDRDKAISELVPQKHEIAAALHRLTRTQASLNKEYNKARVNSGLSVPTWSTGITATAPMLSLSGILGLSKLSTPPGFHEFMKGEGAVLPQRGAKDSAKKRSSPSTPNQPKKKRQWQRPLANKTI